MKRWIVLLVLALAILALGYAGASCLARAMYDSTLKENPMDGSS